MIVGEILAALLDVGDLVEEVGGLGIGEVVLRLSVRVGVLEQAHELRSGGRGGKKMTSVLLSGGVKLFSSSRLSSAGDRARGARTWRDARTARVRPAGIGHRSARRDGAIRSRRSTTRDAATPREPRAIFFTAGTLRERAT